ncbi:Alpha/Beta hydrolase protein [Irpex rosettiformis]|uniref:Alpha/Beta hydrolase protein n=1 Tax=Irpex rosettiformis TaxID=378272 RepID=A0ACB8TTG4_9APHY|nr:Alpha/Beta hydrolase protein [Irpex rosettiformis]
MEAIAAHSDLVDNVPQQAGAMKAAFHPLLEAREAEINSFQTKRFTFGPSERHSLDVYFPKTSDSSSAPILFFVYGGGYAEGAKVLPPPYHLIHKNVGAFFANQGLVTVISDYRLVPHIKFPDPSADIRDAFAFVHEHIDDINAGVHIKGDIDRVFFMGHSAGAAIISTMMLLPGFVPDDLRKRIQGLVLLGGAYHFRAGPPPPPVAAYYENEEGWRRNEPLALLEKASKELVRNLPPILVLVSENEPRGIAPMSHAFSKTLGEKQGAEVPVLTMKGHNHTSVAFSLFSGVGEDWAHEVVGWVKHQGQTHGQLRSKV